MALLIKPKSTCAINTQRADELRSLAAEEGIKLPMPIDAILWFESQGYIVDLITGLASKVDVEAVTPLGRTINHLMTPAPAVEYELVDADVEALIEEVYGKPGLGVDDSAGLFDETDCIADAYALGQQDQAVGRYAPPAGIAEHDAYIRGQNDAWAAANKIIWWQRGER